MWVVARTLLALEFRAGRRVARRPASRSSALRRDRRGRRTRPPSSRRDDRRATRARAARRADVGDAACGGAVASLLAVTPSIWAQDFGCDIQSARGRGRCTRLMCGCYIFNFSWRHVLSPRRGSATSVADGPSTVPQLVSAPSPRRPFESKFLHTLDLEPPWEPIPHRAHIICNLASDPPCAPCPIPQLGADGPKSRNCEKSSSGSKTGEFRVCDTLDTRERCRVASGSILLRNVSCPGRRVDACVGDQCRPRVARASLHGQTAHALDPCSGRSAQPRPDVGEVTRRA